jgi:hypothetical protein
MRFTDGLPPVKCWRAIPNWKHALDGEGRSGQDETTIKPCKEQESIPENADYTTGETWLPDGQVVPAFIAVGSAGEPRHILCAGDVVVWEFDCLPEGFGVSALTAEQRARFPLRVVSHLSRSPGDPSRTIRVVVDARGRVTPWEFDDVP